MAHKDVLIESSDFFRAASNLLWKEGKERLVRLPDVAPTTFEVYIGWLYTDEVDIADAEATQDVREDFDLLIACFALGDMLQDVHFMNSVVNRFIKQAEDRGAVPSPCCIARLCDTVRLDSTLARVCVDYAAFDTQQEPFEKDVDAYPEVFVMMIAKASVRYGELSRRKKKPVNRKPCFYHEHPKGKGSTKTCSNIKSEQSEGT